MKKDFLTVTPDSGTSGEVDVIAEPNPTFEKRETMLNFSANGGLNTSVKAVQTGIPFLVDLGYYSSITGADRQNVINQLFPNFEEQPLSFEIVNGVPKIYGIIKVSTRFSSPNVAIGFFPILLIMSSIADSPQIKFNSQSAKNFEYVSNSNGYSLYRAEVFDLKVNDTDVMNISILNGGKTIIEYELTVHATYG